MDMRVSEKSQTCFFHQPEVDEKRRYLKISKGSSIIKSNAKKEVYSGKSSGISGGKEFASYLKRNVKNVRRHHRYLTKKNL